MAQAHAFSDGEIVAERFRILRRLGQGGMGEVYEAEDLALQERVALKTIRPGIASDARALQRFKQEIQLARKVTHPNVCRIFDLAQHGEVTFLTMELLEGETLRSRLQRAPMKPEEALPIIEQLAAGLAAAHKVGIVHRDFKPGNVILARIRAGGARAVITDFGLARPVAEGDATVTALTGEGFIGTPAYMAPEQLQGAAATPATDIYALGLVMYEMITGALPFSGDSPFLVALKRLQEPPRSPRTLVPDLEPKWERVILRCLAGRPADRFPAASDVAVTLRGAPAAGRRLRLWVALGALAALIAAVPAFLLLTPRQTAPGIRSRPSVAVIGFKNLSGQAATAWLSTAFAEMLTSELASGEKLRTIPSENIARMKTELSLADTDSFARDTLVRIRANVGSDFVVLGSYLAVGGQIRLDLRIQDTRAGEMVASATETGRESELLQLVSRAGERLRSKLGAPVSAEPAGAGQPRNAEAARLYAEGLNRLRSYNALEARELLEKAIAADPQSAQAHSALAAALSALGYDNQARAEARRASELAGRLPREERLFIEARYRKITAQWPQAIEIYRRLWDFFPDNLEYGLQLAEAQALGGKGQGALATVAALRELAPPASSDPRIDLAEAFAAETLGNFKQEQGAAAAAARKGKSLGSSSLTARARLLEGSAWWSLSEPKKALAAYDEARAIFTSVHDMGGLGRTLNNIAVVQKEHGDPAGALRTYGHALETARQIGDRSATAKSLNNLANALADLGDLAQANRYLAESLAIKREIGDTRGVAVALLNLAQNKLETGDVAGAQADYSQAHALSRELGNKRLLSHAAWGLGEISRIQDKLAESRRKHEDALSLRKETGSKLSVAVSRRALAWLALEEARAKEAEAVARETAEEFRAADADDDQAASLILLANSLLAQQRLADARGAADEASRLAEKSGSRYLRLHAAVISARIRAASGNRAEALRLLASAQTEAVKLGFLPLQYEARLARGQIDPAHSGLSALAREARRQGFLRIARKAAEPTSRP